MGKQDKTNCMRVLDSKKIAYTPHLYEADPTLTGTGNADYFMGGKHIAGVWERKDYDSRTVFYGEDGNEIELQRGRTLIILMGYNNKKSKVSYE